MDTVSHAVETLSWSPTTDPTMTDVSVGMPSPLKPKAIANAAHAGTAVAALAISFGTARPEQSGTRGRAVINRRECSSSAVDVPRRTVDTQQLTSHRYQTSPSRTTLEQGAQSLRVHGEKRIPNFRRESPPQPSEREREREISLTGKEGNTAILTGSAMWS